LCYKIGENLYAAWVMFHDGIWGFFWFFLKIMYLTWMIFKFEVFQCVVNVVSTGLFDFLCLFLFLLMCDSVVELDLSGRLPIFW
jgi:hypothetical protein